MGGADCVGGQGKDWMRCFLDDLRAFGTNADQWTTAAQDEREWSRTAEQGAEHIMMGWIAAAKARAVMSFSGVTFVLFRFRLYTFIEAAALRSIVLR